MKNKILVRTVAILVLTVTALSLFSCGAPNLEDVKDTFVGLIEESLEVNEILFGEGLKQTEIGYLPQQTVVQRDFPASVYEIVLSGCHPSCGIRPFYGAAEKKRAAEAMEKMNIAHLQKRCYRELSGGQQQRVLLARALCATKKLLLLDEPVTGLDPKVTYEMYELISEINKGGITVIMISHDISAAKSYASHILYLGKEIFFGTRDEYLKSSIAEGFGHVQGGEE